MSNRSANSWWPYLVSFLILAIVANILFSGLRALMDYKKSAAPALPVNLATLHFFTKEYLQRRYQELTVDKLPTETSLPSFHVYTNPWDLASLESNLPSSARTRYIPGHIKVDEPDFSSEMQFRYRGGLPLHWLYDKKSLRIKLPPYKTYRGERSFNLVNPSTLYTITDWISYDMARELGLLAPDYFPARLFINNDTNGLHFFLSEVDESLLRKNRRMPGSIYSGDTIYVPNSFGVDKPGLAEQVFKAEDGTSLMWQDERLWEKEAARNSEAAEGRADIQKFLEIVNLKDPVAFMKAFETYLDKDKYYAFWGLDTLVGTYHHDNFHNHKIYFDPYKGKFEPIEWDLRYWSSIFMVKDLPVNPLLRQIILNPVLEYERDKAAYDLLEHFPVSDIKQRIEKADAAVMRELAADPFRQLTDVRYGRFDINKEMPFSMRDYEQSIEDLKLIYQKRHDFLNTIYESALGGYWLTEAGRNITLTLAVTGNSPIDFNPWTLVPQSLRSETSIVRSFKGKETPVVQGSIERLYPGRVIAKGNVLGRVDNWSLLAFGNERLEPAPLSYDYRIRGPRLQDLIIKDGLSGRNAITGKDLLLKPVARLPDLAPASSVHPWNLPSSPETQDVVLAGQINIDADRTYSPQQRVRIMPGTVFNLAKGRSLLFYGQVLAEGTAVAPIIFRQKAKGEPWGSVAIQGKAASGSRLRHIQVSGGSVTSQHLINYTAQLNIHDLDDFRVEDCYIKDNHIGDDAMHVAYSRGEITGCRFENTAFDALDIDIAEISISNSVFINSGNDAMDFMTSKITASDISVEGAKDKCFSVGEATEASISSSRLHGCQIGIAVKDESKARVEDLEFKGNREAAIALYLKNPRYGTGGTIAGGRLSGITPEDISVDESSVSHLTEEAFLPAGPGSGAEAGGARRR